MKPYSLLLLIGLLCSFTSSLYAQTLSIGVGLSKPPYVIQDLNAGMEYEVIQRSLEIAGYKMQPKYMPLKRITYALNGGALDGGMHMRSHMKVDGFFSAEVMTYRNYGVTLKSSALKITDIGDLRHHSVVAFQNAHKVLGKAFHSAVKANKQYSELANQELQVRLLAAGRKQVVVSDFRIFLHFKKKVEAELGRKIEVQFHELFPPSSYRVAFRRKDIRDRFDQALASLRQSGEYEKILAKYISPDDLAGLTR
ncbi:transporter substrate-binding domain-containing protein [Terasakiella sp. SH-1]|uniref:substrate-binding periplasmic protein n=1 Tax=Terasakiella sp. SH-1 TaxID=2560057 RepID=UPI00142FD34A|nr:transporter substrate-binding domain-containing protein [Terasakiella sp. SH-1]